MIGPFAKLFDRDELGVPAYLVLLDLRAPERQLVLSRIETVLEDADAPTWVTALLRDTNWRRHLLGAISVVLRPALGVDLLWDAIDRDSWVAPQLVAVAAHVDPQFRERARSRVEISTNSKNVASLLAACAELPELAAWRTQMLADPRIQALLATDASHNDSDQIVAHWSGALRDTLAERGGGP